MALRGISQKQNNTKLYVNDTEYLYSMNANDLKPGYRKLPEILDTYKMLESILSKQFPSERYNGIVNMFYVSANPNATSEEIASVVVSCAVLTHAFEFEKVIAKLYILTMFPLYFQNYLDGTDNAATKISYLDLHHFPDSGKLKCKLIIILENFFFTKFSLQCADEI